ncbi:four-carbon acid sugar kinase family protein [Rhizobium sp. Leaf371]|uniref:four-carbon acid sugar kinase family protein n=1 Tax=Rhizobium sp. Leaf371 TaxID=1736355 RepID=UPI000AB53FDD|nr:four-carbon acid sugar kinase family protein [Rhizobium sp. Leaf371]
MVAPLLLSYYGDDFTGSTDVMEALASRGVETVLFLRIPDDALLQRFAHCRAIGLAGTSRSETPGWMDDELKPVFEWLEAREAAICHYKVCSTFDSAPTVGNIGRAIEIGLDVFRQDIAPLVVGAPQLRRYTAFGHLFAGYQKDIFRIDRHPVMSRHPVTPMNEADLTLHLGRQTALPIALADLTALTDAGVDARVATMAGKGILMLDVDGPETQKAAGAQLLRLAQRGSRFMAGSSGIEYALLQAWQAEGLVEGVRAFPSPGRADRIAVVSGSVSPTTERQIRQATGADGFDGVPLDPLELLGENGEYVMGRAVEAAEASLAAGRSVILHTALGPEADRGGEIDRVAGSRHRLGQMLGRILLRLIETQGLGRAVIAGGDTSSHALGALKVDALTTLLPLPETPGSPLCTAHGLHAPTNGLQIALKGGQVGRDGYFAQIRDGHATSTG